MVVEIRSGGHYGLRTVQGGQGGCGSVVGGGECGRVVDSVLILEGEFDSETAEWEEQGGNEHTP